MKWNVLGSFLALTAILLAGCMYPEKELTKNQVPYQDQIQAVQTAVDSFREDNGGILPIKTKEAETPIYQKYPIEFKKITPKYMAERIFFSRDISWLSFNAASSNPTQALRNE